MSDHRPATTLVALRYRDYRLLLIGQVVSLAGSQMQLAALNWHVYELTREPIYLGMIGLVRVIPIVVLSLIGGVMADAVDRRRLMLLTQTALALVAAVLAAITFGGAVSVWLIFLLSAAASAATAFDLPARQALVPRLVPREHLPNALSLYTTMFQVATIAGPFLAGQVIARANIAWVYAINAVSFAAVIAALALLRTDTAPRPGEAQPVNMQSALEGFRFVWRTPIIRWTMLLDFVATLFSSANALLPVFAQDVLHVGADWYGVLAAAPSVGAFATGALMSTLVASVRRQGRVLLASVAAYGLATVVFGLSVWPWLSFLALAGTGAADTVSMVLRNTIRQLATPDTLRGRMTSVNMIFFMGGPQLGELEAGLVAQAFGAPFSVISGGLGCLLAVGFVAWGVPSLRGYEGEAPLPATGGEPAAPAGVPAEPLDAPGPPVSLPAAPPTSPGRR
jgi:MFS family permease